MRARELKSVRICTECNVEKDINDFCRNKACKTGYTGHCKVCNRKRQKESKAKRNPEDIKFEQVQRKFGINKDDYIKLLQQQASVCPICRVNLKITSKSLDIKTAVIDHDHKTNKIRGILCKKCNLLLGLADDSVDILLGAIDYLKWHQKK